MNMMDSNFSIHQKAKEAVKFFNKNVRHPSLSQNSFFSVSAATFCLLSFSWFPPRKTLFVQPIPAPPAGEEVVWQNLHPLPLSQNKVDCQVASLSNPTPKVGARLAQFVPAWRKITSDIFVLSIIQFGFQISVSNIFPGVIRKTTVVPHTPEFSASIKKEIADLFFKWCNSTGIRLSSIMSFSPL